MGLVGLLVSSGKRSSLDAGTCNIIFGRKDLSILCKMFHFVTEIEVLSTKGEEGDWVHHMKPLDVCALRTTIL